jgi:hypothetical protein
MIEPALGIIEAHRASVYEIFKYFKGLNKNAQQGDLWVYVPGNTKMPLLVAHADTVHLAPPTQIYHDTEKNHLLSPQGIGSDDRAGIYALAALYENLDPKPGLLICDQEESGGRGAWSASWDLADELREYPFFLELDRRGVGECVFYNQEPLRFVRFIESFGFKEDWGLFSDISVLGRELKRCSANVSVGYEKNHQIDEYLVIEHLIDTLVKVKILCETCMSMDLYFKLPKPVERPLFSKSFAEFEAEAMRDPYPCDATEEEIWEIAEHKEWDTKCEMCHIEGPTFYTNLSFGWCCKTCFADLDRADMVYNEDDINRPVPLRADEPKPKKKRKSKRKRKRERALNRQRRYSGMSTVNQHTILKGEKNHDQPALYPERIGNTSEQAG